MRMNGRLNARKEKNETVINCAFCFNFLEIK